MSFLAVVRGLGLANERTLRQALRSRARRMRTGELLSELGIVKAQDLRIALSMHPKQDVKQRLGEILTGNRTITESQFT